MINSLFLSNKSFVNFSAFGNTFHVPRAVASRRERGSWKISKAISCLSMGFSVIGLGRSFLFLFGRRDIYWNAMRSVLCSRQNYAMFERYCGRDWGERQNICSCRIKILESLIIFIVREMFSKWFNLTYIKS